MAAIIELKYFNTFWLKKIEQITKLRSTAIAVFDNESALTITVTPDPAPVFGVPTSPLDETMMNVGQEVTMTYVFNGDTINYFSYITERAPGSVSAFKVAAAPVGTVPAGTKISFGKIINFDKMPQAYGTGNVTTDWLLEESRIRGGYNNTSVDFGVKAYLVEDEPKQSHKFSSLIHSGIFNSRTGVNQTNQFSVAEDITRTIDPANGSIQKLYAEDTNLIIFQESKVSKSLIDKDAIYSAEGNASVTSRNLVIGQNIAYAGEYGISTDPESFAVNGYRKYFTDRDQNVVCRLSMDGISVISSFGMTDFFRGILSRATKNGIKAGWDAYNKQYVLSVEDLAYDPVTGSDRYRTLSFDETVKGWTSTFTYKPNYLISLNNNFFTTKDGAIYKHYELMPNISARGMFYGQYNGSSVVFVFNGAPSMVKNFQTINYEGDTGWSMTQFNTNTDKAWRIDAAQTVTTLQQMQDSLMQNRFKKVEDKYYANLSNNSDNLVGQVLPSTSSSGVTGFYAEATMRIIPSSKKELFAVSTEFVKSS